MESKVMEKDGGDKYVFICNPKPKQMKKLLLAIMVAVLPVCVETASAQLFAKKFYQGRKDNKEYLQGAVPQVDGKVVFSKEFIIKKNVYDALKQWAERRFQPDAQQGEWKDVNYFRNGKYAFVKTPDKNTIICRGDEDMVFNRIGLGFDQSLVNYSLTLNITKTKVVATISNIIYTYRPAEDVDIERFFAEEKITDSEALSKEGNLRHGTDKFRIKTIDLVDELFSEIEANLK